MRSRINLITGFWQAAVLIVTLVLIGFYLSADDLDGEAGRPEKLKGSFDTGLRFRSLNLTNLIREFIRNPAYTQPLLQSTDDGSLPARVVQFYTGFADRYKLDIFSVFTRDAGYLASFAGLPANNRKLAELKIIRQAAGGAVISTLESTGESVYMIAVAPLSDKHIITIGQKIDSAFLGSITATGEYELAVLTSEKIAAASDTALADAQRESGISAEKIETDSGSYYAARVSYGETDKEIEFLVWAREGVAGRMAGNLLMLALLVIGLSVVAFIVSHIYTRRMVDFIRRLSRSMNDFAAETRLSTSSDASDEIEQIATVFEEMKTELTRMRRLELEVAADLQKKMLPDKVNLGNFSVAISFLPYAPVSGDFYDFGNIAPKLDYIMIADVSGHGVASALLGGMTRMSLDSIDLKKTTPSKVMSTVAGNILKITEEYFLTAVYMMIDSKAKTLKYSNAGHVPPIILSKTGRVRELGNTRSILGIMNMPAGSQRTVKYRRGDRMLLYTDGLMEQTSPSGEQFGREQIIELMKRTSDKTVKVAKNEILRELYLFLGGKPVTDDITMMLIDL